MAVLRSMHYLMDPTNRPINTQIKLTSKHFRSVSFGMGRRKNDEKKYIKTILSCDHVDDDLRMANGGDYCTRFWPGTVPSTVTLRYLTFNFTICKITFENWH